MTRKKIKHEQLPDGNKRNTIYKNRQEDLLKEATELSTLCGVDVAIVIHTPERNNDVEWASPEIFRESLQKFMNLSYSERFKKMVLHDEYLEQEVDDEMKHVVKLQKNNELREFNHLMSELEIGKINVDNLNLYQLDVLQSHSAEFLKKLQEREDELNNNEQNVVV